jgi:hypothetical protein
MQGGRERGAEVSARSTDTRGALLVAALEARRTAPLALLALLFLVTYAAARTSSGASVAPLLAELTVLEADTPIALGLARASAATLGLALAALVLVVHAAGLVTRWRNGDADWLGARPIGATRALATSFVGLALGASALVLAVFAAIALAERAPARELVWRAGPERHIVLRPGEQYIEEVRSVSLPSGAVVRVRVQNTALDIPYGDVGLLVERHEAAADPSNARPRVTQTESRTRVARRSYAEGTVPAAAALESDAAPLDATPATDAAPSTLVVVVTALGPGSLVVAGPTPIELWGPPESAAWVDLALGGRALALLVAAALLAAGLGAWLAAPLAALTTLALCIGVGVLAPEAWPALDPALARCCPGHGLGAALDVAAEGRRPAFAPVGHLVGVLGTALLALALARGALGSWRHAP